MSAALTGLRATQQEPTQQSSGSKFLRDIRLSLASGYYNMVQALGLKKLTALLQSVGNSGLQCHTKHVWILGVRYLAEDESEEAAARALEQLLLDFSSRPWMTYRKGFTALDGQNGFTSDVGWGCMIRSGQMLLAQALVLQRLGRDWRWQDGQTDVKLQQILSLFSDHPSQPLSMHALCKAGQPYGVRVGEWLGPSVLCKALEAAVNSRTDLGLRIHVVAEPGGGAPTLYTSEVDALLANTATSKSGLVLLVPVVLGLGKINASYLPQLERVLEFPQSLGIVGGRPSSSLYFIGHQDGQLLYLDPHEVQEIAEPDGDWSSYKCQAVRMMPAASIDPSVAVAFYVADASSFAELCKQLKQLEADSGSTPMLAVRNSAPSWVSSPRDLDVMSEEGEPSQPQVEGWEVI